MAGDNATVLIVGTLVYLLVGGGFMAGVHSRLYTGDRALGRLYVIATAICLWMFWIFCVLSQLYPLKYPMVIIQSANITGGI